jgi:outer membrane protein assembly factor BamB
MTAVNATTGEELWNHTLYQPVAVKSNPAVVDGVVYFGSHASNVKAVDATTGDQIWNFSAGDIVGSDPTVVNDTVYIGSGYRTGSGSSDPHKVYALNATDGTERWNFTLVGEVNGGVAYADDTIYAASRGGNLTARNASTGAKV